MIFSYSTFIYIFFNSIKTQLLYLDVSQGRLTVSIQIVNTKFIIYNYLYNEFNFNPVTDNYGMVLLTLHFRLISHHTPPNPVLCVPRCVRSLRVSVRGPGPGSGAPVWSSSVLGTGSCWSPGSDRVAAGR